MLDIIKVLLLTPLLAAATTPLEGSFTLTAYKPRDNRLDGAKLNYVGGAVLFKEKVRQYCPQPPVEVCPNGNDTVWLNGLYPSSMVPGGQDSYVLASGQVLITPQHSHSKPNDAFWGYEGFFCTNDVPQSYGPPSSCPEDNPVYDCRKPIGLCTWKLPKQQKGGVFACRNPYDPAGTSIFVKTPHFNQTGCTELEGLAAHQYDGPNPPVWSYV